MLSRVLAASGAALLLPLLLSLYERGPILPFLVPMLLSAALSLFLKRKGAAIESSLTPREGTAITALSWIAFAHSGQDDHGRAGHAFGILSKKEGAVKK